jgi:CxxC-x17-CxxC domain-containing protein
MAVPCVRRPICKFAVSVLNLKKFYSSSPRSFLQKLNTLVIISSPILNTRRSPVVFQDRSLTCSECGSSFAFTADDQQYHAEKGYTNDPKRCPNCRQARRAQRNQESFGGLFGSSYTRQMYPAVCAECGKNTEVPFQPRGDRPVYCRDCFNRQRVPSRSNGFR